MIQNISRGIYINVGFLLPFNAVVRRPALVHDGVNMMA